MAYSIYFSGLIAFLEYNNFERVDALLLNPVPAHSHGAGQAGHAHQHGANGDHPCSDQHVPQLMVRMAHLEQWRLCGVVHGCGWRHFDLTGKTVFPGLIGPRRVTVNEAKGDTPPASHLGFKYTLSPFDQSVVDLGQVLGIPASPASFSSASVVARVRLPQGTLMALTGRRRRAGSSWRIGHQVLPDLPELYKFVPARDETNIEIHSTLAPDNGFVTLRNVDDVEVWITNEPLCRSKAPDAPDAPHFMHFYDLIPRERLQAARQEHARRREDGQGPAQWEERPLPRLEPAAANIDDPICPECLLHTNDPI